MAAYDNLQPGQFFSKFTARSISEGYDVSMGGQYPDVQDAYELVEIPTPKTRHDYWNFPSESHLYNPHDHEDRVKSYQQDIDNLPPVLLNYRGEVSDGFHRTEAHRRARRPIMLAFRPTD